MAKIVLDKCLPLRTYPNKSPSPAKTLDAKPQSGGKFCKILIDSDLQVLSFSWSNLL